MRTSEGILVGYLIYLAILVWTRPFDRRTRALVTAGALVDGLAVGWLSTARAGLLLVARDWLPALHLLVGYWLSGAFFVRPTPGLEAALRWWDEQLGAGWLARHGPRWLLEYLELAYLAVYVVVPVGFGIVYLSLPEAPVDAYWTIVLSAGLACYGLLPWLQSRPPTAVGLSADVDARHLAVRRLNLRVLERGSIRANTLPSGHAATASATALATGLFVPDAFLPLALLALSIAVASTALRYHYAVDSVLGVAVAIVAWGLLRGMP